MEAGAEGCRPDRATPPWRPPGDDLRIGAEPVGLLDELAALDLEDLHPATAFMVGSVDLERRNQTAEAEIVDRFEAFLHIFPGRLLAARRLERIADRLDMDGGPKDAAVVNHRVVHLLRRLFALRL